MKRKKYSEEQIIGILKEAERGVGVQELCRMHGMSEASFYTWRSKYGGMDVSDAKKLRALEEENRRLDRFHLGLIPVRLVFSPMTSSCPRSIQRGWPSGTPCLRQVPFREKAPARSSGSIQGENGLKQMVAEQALDIQMLKAVNAKKW
jgi:putative transposase